MGGPLKENQSGRFLKELFGLDGKVAVVVGGPGVLCGAMAKGLWQAGCKIVLVGRSSEEARFFEADVTKRDQAARIIPAVLKWFDRIDIWINGPGVNPPIPYLEITDQEFDAIVQTNLKSVHVVCQLIGKHWIDHGQRGSIINLSSMSALRPLSRVFVYSLSKAALWNLTQNLAREWAPNGIRVNALCPGFFPAEQNRQVLDKSRVEAILGGTPMGRFGEPQELVGATLLLASERAAGFITGLHLVVDGGFAVTSI
jgi:NAD(P)-dependent dehydrogenase (short-subunit alcohol dehydrogenase family)